MPVDCQRTSPAHGHCGSGSFGTQAVNLRNRNFFFTDPLFDDGGVADVGAVTLCSATTGCSGTVTAANSLVGSTANDTIGNSTVTTLTNGNLQKNCGWMSQ
ncbi:MAG: hypothetical protein MSG64_07275 [Pyrinomonadaceae bacterium MAG19_C2-C3]|nr:hypothetical protein [Pyrinomonadaceae bacterium MAG19_C2-C3]